MKNIEYIEDLIIELATSPISLNLWDLKIVDGFYITLMQGTGFTLKQSQLAVRILQKHSINLLKHMQLDITNLLENPKFRISFRETVKNKNISIIDFNNKTEFQPNTKFIKVQFPYNEGYVAEIRKYRTTGKNTSFPVWSKELMAWIFLLTEENIEFLANLFAHDDFDYDETFQDYVIQFENIIENMENYAPMLILDNGTPKIVNSPPEMPKISTTDILESVFQARRFGINLWSDDIDQFLTSFAVDLETAKFLSNTNHSVLHLDQEKHGISCLTNIVKYLGPSLFIIPGGNEYDKLEQAYTILSAIGIDNKNMSVLFRLPTETGKKFNDFVKNQGLNNSIDEHTKIVFVSTRLPKTVFKSNIEFESVVNLGLDSAHYALKEYAKNHQNLVYFNVKKTNRNKN
jgi:hypothetical protein